MTVMAQLKEMITEAHSRPDVKAIVIQGATFCLLFGSTATAYSVLVQVEM
jgi:enoyl-CoA hydratase/carnithine racemase